MNCSSSSASRGRCSRRSGRRAGCTARSPRRSAWAACRSRASPATSRPPCSASSAPSPGLTKNTYGTGCFMLQCTGPKAVASKNNLVTTVAWTMNGRTDYALEGSVFIAGAVVQWLRDGLGIIRTSEEVRHAGARRSRTTAGSTWCRRSPGSGPRTGTRTPAARSSASPAARRPGTSPGRPWRGSRSSRPTCSTPCGPTPAQPVAELRVDGGACRSDLLMQFQADLLGVPVVRPAVTETTALGAAYLAGLAVGSWKSPARSRRSGKSSGGSSRR